jgi:hypothetical protein
MPRVAAEMLQRLLHAGSLVLPIAGQQSGSDKLPAPPQGGRSDAAVQGAEEETQGQPRAGRDAADTAGAGGAASRPLLHWY